MKYNYTVTDGNGKNWPNLVGVFGRIYPVVCGKAENENEIGHVYYYGERFTITPKSNNRN